MYRKSVLLFTGLALLVLGAGFKTTQDGKAKAADREADKLAIDQLTKEMIQAFENRDAAAVAAHWTVEGEFIRNDGEAIRGRAEVQKGYADYFKTLKGKPKLEIQVDGLRFPSTDTAVSQVSLRQKDDDGE